MKTESNADAALPRVLGPWMATAVVIGTVIGSGIFKKPVAVAKEVEFFGPAMLAWVLVGVLTLLGSLALAEVAVLFPRAGGNYAFLKEALGRPGGFLWGWVEFWVIRSASIAALATIFTEALHDVLRGLWGTPEGVELISFWGRQGLTVGVIAALALVNAVGTVLGGALQVLVTAVKVAALLSFAVLPLLFFALGDAEGARVDFNNLQPAWPTDWSASFWSHFGAALVGVLWAYHGWMNVAPVAEEVRDPGRNLPIALVVGVLAVIGLYLAVNLAYALLIPQVEMTQLGDRPVAAEFAARLLGPAGLVAASAAIMISVFGSLNGNLLVGPRLLFAMGRDGLAPRALCSLKPFGTPALAELVLASWTILLVVVAAALVRFGVPIFTIGDWDIDLNLPPNTDVFDLLTDYAIFGATSFETMAVASLFAFRRRFPPLRVQLPYRCWGYPWLPLIYVLAMAAVLLNMCYTKPTQSLAAIGFIVVGAAVYAVFFGGRGRPAPITAPEPEPVGELAN